MPNLGPTELIIIAVVIVLLFGWKRLPDAARSLGRSARVFKSEVNEMKIEDEQRKRADDAKATGSAIADDTTPRTDNQSGPTL
ncbi:Sec-independent protein translocase subunit TatA [Nostocoides sp.]|jgi:sec-independent protein translocase protein TatA|uniref:Sec-independent protein translocase subunit TatA n=1 Tax=Nostocoides sp. TaxID=1917966 RepID=UPI003BB1D7BB